MNGQIMEQYLTFMLENDFYAFNVLKIREVLEVTKITRVPKTPDFIAGVIKLRGKVVPVIDLSIKFQMKKADSTVDTSIIIVEVDYEGEMIIIGALVDAVKAVIKLEQNQLEPPPKVGLNIDLGFIEAIGKHNNEFVLILSIDKIFSSTELDFISKEYSEKDENMDAVKG